MSVGILYDELFTDHYCAHYHPERPERLEALRRGLRSCGVLEAATDCNVREATTDELGRVHHPNYIENVLAALEQGSGFLDPDTFFSEGSRRAALCAAGGGVDLALAVHAREVDWGWALVRPPGHHASWGRPAGFCIFNNIAVAVAALLETTDAERVAIFDWDVHHGNGTQDQFWEDDRVLFASTHQWPHYPGSGLSEQIGGGDAAGKTVNFPFPAGCGDSDLLAALDDVFAPLVRAFDPDHILISAGFDAHEDDPLAGLRVTTPCYGAMATRLRELAARHCNGRLTLFLEGGYDLRVLTEAGAAVAEALESSEERANDRAPQATPRGRAVIDKTVAEIRGFWPGVF
jgi:acetoin utilization deacetylase AcuC-like enzyme